MVLKLIFLKLRDFIKVWNMINLKNSSPKILVIGDLMIDHYLWGTSQRISPEAPVPVVKINQETSVLGGAGNVINNLNALGAKIDVISVIGDCNASSELILLLNKLCIDTTNIIKESGRILSKKSRLISSQLQVARYDQESTDEISTLSQKSLISIMADKIGSNYDCILLSDYGKGILTEALTQKIIKLAKKNSIKVLVDPKGHNYSKYKGAFLLTPNKKEASDATKIEIIDDESLLKAISLLKNKYKLDFSLITLSENGIAIYDDELRKYASSSKEVFDVTGAGDTVLASLGFAISCGLNIDEAVKFSNLAAGVVVGKIGSATATVNEIIKYDSKLNKSSSNKYIKNLSEIITISKDLRLSNQKIIFTNGCFDLLHVGHIKYLEQAKRFGDILIIGLNSDRSVKKLKGPGRPINSQDDRALLLAALESVDYVVIFNDETPYNLINSIKPHTLVKGGDYEDKKVAGQEIVDELKIVKFIKGRSTTKTIQTIQNQKNI